MDANQLEAVVNNNCCQVKRVRFKVSWRLAGFESQIRHEIVFSFLFPLVMPENSVS